MKILSILFLMLISLSMHSQDKKDHLLNRLYSITGEERIEILKDLCRGKRYNNPKQALRHGQEGLALEKELKSDGFRNQIARYTHIYSEIGLACVPQILFVRQLFNPMLRNAQVRQ